MDGYFLKATRQLRAHHLIKSPSNVRDKCNYYCFSDKETETQGGKT